MARMLSLARDWQALALIQSSAACELDDAKARLVESRRYGVLAEVLELAIADRPVTSRDTIPTHEHPQDETGRPGR